MANLEYGVRNRADTVFESGSVAKQFTAAAIALLVQDGKLALQDPARKYVPELPDFGTPITIQHVLNHTSGLRSQWPMLSLAGRPPTQAVHTVEEILELISGYTELNFKPGDEYPLQQHRVHAARRHRVARVGQVPQRVHAGASVHPARDAPHPVARRFHGDCRRTAPPPIGWPGQVSSGPSCRLRTSSATADS